MSNTIESSRAPEPVGAFPYAKRVGELLFLSGIGPRQRGSKEIPGVTLDPAGNVVGFFACGEDISHQSPDTPLLDLIAEGAEPFFIMGAIAGGSVPPAFAA